MTNTNAVPARLYELGGVPIDRLARRQLSPGTVWEPRFGDGAEPVFDTPPPMTPITARRGETPPQDLTGRRSGLLSVVGYFGRKGSGKQQWICRCVCGLYVLRLGKTLLRGAEANDRCRICRYQAYLRHQSLAQAAGNKYADAVRDRELAQAGTTTTSKETADG